MAHMFAPIYYIVIIFYENIERSFCIGMTGKIIYVLKQHVIYTNIFFLMSINDLYPGLLFGSKDTFCIKCENVKRQKSFTLVTYGVNIISCNWTVQSRTNDIGSILNATKFSNIIIKFIDYHNKITKDQWVPVLCWKKIRC